MENQNLPPFYIGQKVVYITGHNMPKYSVHTVKDVFQSGCKCGSWIIRVETKSPSETRILPEKFNVRCTICGNIYAPNKNKEGGWRSTSFRPIQEFKVEFISYERVILEQPVSAN